MYKLQYTNKFQKSIKKLSDDARKMLPKQLLQLERDPHHNSLYTKKNHSVSNEFKETIYESRINQKYRILWKYQNGKVIMLLVAGDHKIVEGKK